jgi:type II secretory ATPase GspE/PulE/Tfp pilus assembly ATPase PilB-like protein
MKTDNIAALINAKKFAYCVGIREDIALVIEHFFSSYEGRPMEGAGGPGGEDAGDAMEDLIGVGDFVEDADDRDFEKDEISEASSQIVRMVDQIIITAFRKDASDIHIEPSPAAKKTGIRFRIDGVCQDFLQVPITTARGLISRLKIMAKLDIAERRLPQDGKIKFKRKGIKPFELRIATLPTASGFEDAVLRILAESGTMKIDEMGVSPRNLEVIKKIIAQPYGLFLVVGPTGSGKTTTLHAALGHINKPGIKIWTAEDPVEITQPGLRQVECKPKIGLDFARIMRAFLRADPDVIMIGEMRDRETASIGIEASLTGHLVMSTLHTNSAPESVTRLLDMGLNPLNFSDAFLGVLAQRLVRRLCTKCRRSFQPSVDELAEIAALYGKEGFEASGLAQGSAATLYRAVGCEECYNSGYKGRLGIHELMHGSKEIKRLIKKVATTEEIFQQAARDGMKTLVQDGIHKVFDGLTDLAEIRRVCVS